MASPVSLSIREGEQVAIVGANASGKTRLVEILTGHYRLRGDAIRFCFSYIPEGRSSNVIRYISFCDAYGEIDNNYFLQLRWNQTEISEETPTARQFLNKVGTTEGSSTSDDNRRKEVYRLFGLEPLLDRYIVNLSSGELRKCQLARVLLSCPRVLIIDNPFIGLDTTACDILVDAMRRIIAQERITLILVLPRATQIPSFITHVIPVNRGHVLPIVSREEFLPHDIPCPQPVLSSDERLRILSLPEKDLSQTPFYPQRGGEILQFNNVSIRYGGRAILENINWTVCEGERWALTGANGSGKSTLLSLVCADNPQGYACDIRLFGHRRGTGESIWEIKRHIGYVSPELHRAYRKNIPAIDLVASGFHDTVGLYTRSTDNEKERCLFWMEIFGIRHLATRPYLQLSSGEQRLCLLVRAFVKDPELLILDEPLHGLDEYYHQRVREIITAFCERRHKTLIMVTHHLEELPPCITHHMKLKLKYPIAL